MADSAPRDMVGRIGRNVGMNVRLYRTARGMSQTNLARETSALLGRNLYHGTISEIENGKRRVDADELDALARVLGVVDINTLITGRTCPTCKRPFDQDGGHG